MLFRSLFYLVVSSLHAGPGTWGGHMELLSAARVYGCVILVHQFLMPRFEVQPLQIAGATRVLHVSYHDGEHYNSLHDSKGDPLHETVATCPIYGNAARSGAAGSGSSASRGSGAAMHEDEVSALVRTVQSLTGCEVSQAIQS